MANALNKQKKPIIIIFFIDTTRVLFVNGHVRIFLASTRLDHLESSATIVLWLVVFLVLLQIALHYSADLCFADLCFADLCFADLCFADLCFADLCFADLCFADLYFADLYFADLYFADLYFADLCFADLCFADLCFADLCFVDLCFGFFLYLFSKDLQLTYDYEWHPDLLN
ncbi:pentapeptide repeat-containing protein [Fluoribacter gormanii]|uniref:pentapeptide repeat-containing protein n=1 Tax=Fluoribacter gormanii TaxID=464 RepID=UPI003D7BFFBE